VAATEHAEPLPASNDAAVLAQLQLLAALLPTLPDRSGYSDATLSIRAPAGTPFRVVERLIVIVARSGISRLSIAVAPADARQGEQQLAVPLPIDRGGSPMADPGELRVTVSKTGTDRYTSCFEGWERFILLPSQPVSTPDLDDDLPIPSRGELHEHTERKQVGREFPCDAAGSSRLGSFLQQWLSDPEHEPQRAATGLVDSAGNVPFQAVVEVIDAFRAAGVQQIGFAYHPNRK